MDESMRAQIETHLSHLDGLIQRGRQIRERLRKSGTNPAVMAETRAWQEHCGTTINQLSGGSKAHWLARSFSNAFLMRTADGRAAEAVPPEEIVKRLVEALCKRVEDLGLRVDVRRESDYLTEFTVYTTALSMNYLMRGKFIHP